MCEYYQYLHFFKHFFSKKNDKICNFENSRLDPYMDPGLFGDESMISWKIKRILSPGIVRGKHVYGTLYDAKKCASFSARFPITMMADHLFSIMIILVESNVIPTHHLS